jgi:alpha-tubulin suppressor-like RCC1 family protein
MCPETEPAAGAPAVGDCNVPRSDCDRHASCRNVGGVDRCVCDDDYFGDGLVCDGPPVVSALGTSDTVTCVVVGSGTVRCFGLGEHGGIGLADHEIDIGDDEPASAAPLLAFDQPVKDVAVGELTTCVLFQTGDVRCWGYGFDGQLGTGTTEISNDWGTTKNVRLGGKAVAITGTGRHTCALLDDGALRCWGANASGELGYGGTDARATPDVEGDVELPGSVIDVSAVNDATCAVTEDGSLYCWGSFRFTLDGHPLTVGATASEGGRIDVGASVKQVATAADHVCVLTTAGNVRCFGENFMGQLGYKIFNEPIGDDESIASAGDVDVGGEVKQVVAGSAYTCALLTTGAVRCWGRCGAYAYGNCEPIGDNETPAEAGDALLGGSALHLSAASTHTCALMTDDSVRCWGEDSYGELGYGVLDDVGDLTPPACAGTVPIF